jgi:hypothetical protein
MRGPAEPLLLTPSDFELLVKGILDRAVGTLVDYHSEHHAVLSGSDGDYVIDVVATFSALSAKFVYDSSLVKECHRLRHVPIPRVMSILVNVHSPIGTGASVRR